MTDRYRREAAVRATRPAPAPDLLRSFGLFLRRFRWPSGNRSGRDRCWRSPAAIAIAYIFRPTPPPGLITALNLPKKNNCGEELVQVKRKPHFDFWVFPLDGTWHHTRPCLDNLLAAARTQPADAPIHDFIYEQVLFILSQKPVRFYEQDDPKQKMLAKVVDEETGALDFSKFDRIVYVNKRDIAHNSMSHVDLMIFLFAAAENVSHR